MQHRHNVIPGVAALSSAKAGTFFLPARGVSMGKRREVRVRIALPVRVSGIDEKGNPFFQTALTVDVSRTGARLNGIRCLRATGDMVTVECRGGSAKFVVVWIGQFGSSEDGQFGVRSLEPAKRIFKVEFPPTTLDTFKAQPDQEKPVAVGATPALRVQEWDGEVERRVVERLRCSGTGQITQQGVAYPIWAKICDISLGGCYLELIFTLPKHTPIDLRMTINERTFSAKGKVATSHPGIGIGVRFISMDGESRAVLEQIIQELITKRNTELERRNLGGFE
jgi:hypothetical protein